MEEIQLDHKPHARDFRAQLRGEFGRGFRGATGGDTKNTFRITAKGIIVGSALLGLVNVVLFTALATLSAFIYNVCSDLVGGIELTLAEKD